MKRWFIGLGGSLAVIFIVGGSNLWARDVARDVAKEEAQSVLKPHAVLPQHAGAAVEIRALQQTDLSIQIKLGQIEADTRNTRDLVEKNSEKLDRLLERSN